MESLGVLDCVAILVNSSLGAGFLAVPWVFLQLGFSFALVVLGVWIFISLVISLMIVETMSRAEAYARMTEEGFEVPSVKLLQVFKPRKSDPLLKSDFKPEITSGRKFELSQLNIMFLGSWGKHLYNAFMVIGMESVLCSYVMLCVTSMLNNIPLGTYETCNIYEDQFFYTECRYKYWVWLLVVMAIMATLTFMGLKNQKFIQKFSTFARIFILLVMLITSLAALFMDEPLNPSLPKDEVPELSFQNIAMGVPLLKFATGFQSILASVTKEMKNKTTTSYLSIVLTSAVIFVFCGSLGVVTGSALEGYQAPSLSTLAWSGYSAGILPRPLWTVLVEYFVILFPAFNILTSGPITAIALSENIASMVPCKQKFLRGVVWVLPLVLSFFFYDMGKAAAFAGLTAYYVVFISMPLIHMVARRQVTQKSPYEGWHSSEVLAWSIIVFVSFVFILNTYYLLTTL